MFSTKFHTIFCSFIISFLISGCANHQRVENKSDKTELQARTANQKYMDNLKITLKSSLSNSGVEILRHDDYVVLTIPNQISFDANSVVLKGEGKQLIKKIAESLKKFDKIDFHVVGHTDTKGSFARNKQLSTERAQAVADELIAEGFPALRFVVYGEAAAYPVTTNATEEGREKNRRVEITLSLK